MWYGRCAIFRIQLGIGGQTVIETVNMASVQLGLDSSTSQEEAVVLRAMRCWEALGSPSLASSLASSGEGVDYDENAPVRSFGLNVNKSRR